MEPHVLIVEDDTDLREVLVRGLRDEGFAAHGVGTGHELLDRAAGAPPDALIIDIGLPDSDGRDLCQALRAQGIQAPVLFLTARDALADRLAGFGAGGGATMTNPFSLAELTARLRALLHRAGVTGAVNAAGLRIDPTTFEVSCGEESV